MKVTRSTFNKLMSVQFYLFFVAYIAFILSLKKEGLLVQQLVVSTDTLT